MRCKDCKYSKEIKETLGKSHVCSLTHILTNGCQATEKTLDKIPTAKICYNCKFWIGGGDFGLSCMKDYYNCSTNGLEKGCVDFEFHD